MKIIGSDFDGTITTNKVSPQKFKDGIKKYDIDFFDYVICANGAVTLD